MIALVLSLCAVITSAVSAIIGMGGGITLLTLMLLWLDPKTAIPLHGVVQAVSNGSRVLAFRSHVRWKSTAWFAAAALPCPLAALWLLDRLPKEGLRSAMGVFVLYAAWAPKFGVRKIPERTAFVICGILVGTLGLLLGATGPLIAPFFLREGFRKEEIIGTKAACQAFGHILKIVAFESIGFQFRSYGIALVGMGVAAVIGTYLGRRLLSRVSEKLFRRIFKIVLTVLALRLITAGLFG